MNNNIQVMQKLKEIVMGISSLINNKKVIYLDYPLYSNGGDLVIMLGALEFLKEEGFSIVDAFSVHDFSLSRIEKILSGGDVSIVLQGGGNFGDLYLKHQELRRDIFCRFPHANIVLLPQSCHYESEEVRSSDIRLMSSLTNSHFCARDLYSKQIFEESGIGTSLRPDMAHYLFRNDTLRDICSEGVSKYKELRFMRRDIESLTDEKNMNDKDWPDFISRSHLFVIRILVNLQKLLGYRSSKLIFKLWRWYSKRLVVSFFREFRYYESIKTTRLHGHIISCLVERPNTVEDNSYGKNSRYIKQWTGEMSDVSY